MATNPALTVWNLTQLWSAIPHVLLWSILKVPISHTDSTWKCTCDVLLKWLQWHATCTWQAFFFCKHPQLINDDTYQECKGVAMACQAEDAGLGPFTQITPFQSGWRSSQAVNHFIAAAAVPLNPRLLQMRPPPWCECWHQHQHFALGEATLINERWKKVCYRVPLSANG